MDTDFPLRSRARAAGAGPARPPFWLRSCLGVLCVLLVALTARAQDSGSLGGVVINDVPSWRVDHMPYGGVKESGLGRESGAEGLEEYLETKLIAIGGVPR